MPATVAEMLLARADDGAAALLFEDQSWTWREQVDESARWAALLSNTLTPGKPPHVGVLLDNVPEYLFLIGGAALAGATVIGINPTRRGAELASDVRSTDCDLVLTDSVHLPLLAGLDLGMPDDRVWCIDSEQLVEGLSTHDGAPVEAAPAALDPATRLLLLFTSGSTGAPKAVSCSTGRLALIAQSNPLPFTRSDVAYNAMPLFHGNAIMASWMPCLLLGATFALRRRFSASGFLPDVQRFGATFFNYVGRSLAYVLAQPERPGERDNALRFAFGTEASTNDRIEFERRFGCPLIESYGSSEGTISIRLTSDTPTGALGLPPPGQVAAVVDQQTGDECPPASFDEHGRLRNAAQAIGEIVVRGGALRFEGYYNNAEADAERRRGEDYFTGDLGYRDEAGFFYFAGRGADWLRVDSENFASAPVERILGRFPGSTLVAVYGVPDPQTGDAVMATVQMMPGTPFDPVAFADFLTAQRDLGTKWAPRFVRVAEQVPQTATRKLDKPAMRRTLWRGEDPVYVRAPDGSGYELLTPAAREALERSFADHGRSHLLGI